MSKVISGPVAGGLKEALGKGVEHAVASLGRTDGFLTKLKVKVLMQTKLQSVEEGLRAVGKGQLMDEFIGSKNWAAVRLAVELHLDFRCPRFKSETILEIGTLFRVSTVWIEPRCFGFCWRVRAREIVDFARHTLKNRYSVQSDGLHVQAMP